MAPNIVVDDEMRRSAIDMMSKEQKDSALVNGLKHAEETIAKITPAPNVTGEVNKDAEVNTFDQVVLDGEHSAEYKKRMMDQELAALDAEFNYKATTAPADPVKTQEKQQAFIDDAERQAMINNMSPEQKDQAVIDGLDRAAKSIDGLPKMDKPANREQTPEERSFMEDVGAFLKEVPEQFVAGLGDFVNNTVKTARDAGLALGIPDVGALQLVDADGNIDIGFKSKEEVEAAGGIKDVMPSMDEAETIGGSAVRSITNFAAGFIPVAKGLKAAGMVSNVGRGLAAGAITDFTSMDPNQDRLATLLNEVPVLQDVIPDYIADNNPENESVWEGRIKNAIEGATLGVLTEGAIAGISKVFKGYKAAKAAKAIEVPKTPDQLVTEEATAVIARTQAIEEAAEIAPKVDLGPEDILTKTPEGKTYLNHNRITTTDDVHSTLQKMADEVDLGKPVSNKETVMASEKEYLDVQDLLDRPLEQPFTASQAVAARNLMTSSAEELTNLAKLAADPTTTNAENLFQFKRALAVHANIQEVVLKGRRASAQSLQAWNIPAEGKQRATQMLDILNSPDGQNAKKMANMIADLANKLPPEDVVKTVAKSAGKLNNSKFADSLYQIWINGLLSGPKTHLANMTSNIATTVMAVPERFVTAGFDAMRGAGGESFAAARGRAAGFFGGIKDGFALMTGKTTNEALQGGLKADFSTGTISAAGMGRTRPDGVISQGLDYIGSAINAPGWALAKEDAFFKGIAYRMKAQENAYSAAFSEGLSGKAFKERVAELLKNPTIEMTDDAVDFARYQTFQAKPGEATAKFMLWNQSLPGGRWITPFVRTPVNIFKYGVERIPVLNFALKDVREAYRAGGTARSEVMARMAGGGVLMAGVAALTMDGSITGSGPTNPGARRALEQTGWQPYSIKVDDKYISYQRIEPFALMMGFTADVTSIVGQLEEAESDNIMVAGFAAIARNMMSKTYLSGMTNLISAVASGNPTIIGNYMARQAASITPAPFSSLSREINHYFDPQRKDYNYNHDKDMLGISGFARQAVERYKENIPGWGSNAPPLHDVWGDEIHYGSNVCPELESISPINIKEVDKDPVNQMIVDSGIALNLPGRDVMGVRMTNVEYSEYSRLAGKKSKAIIDRMYKAGVFEQLSDGPDGAKDLMIKQAIKKGREFAADRLYGDSPDFHDRVIAAKVMKAQLLRGNQE